MRDTLNKRMAVLLMAKNKKYTIRLTDAERLILDQTIQNKKTCKTVLKRCQILRDLDEVRGSGQTHARIAHIYAVCPATVTNVVKAYVTKGIDEISRHHINPNSGASIRKSDSRTEAEIIRIAGLPAPNGHSRWTLRLLEEQAHKELDIPISKDTIRRILKKQNIDLTKTS